MAWEDRGGRSYYYRKVRRGGRVVSEYVGTGPLAEALVRLDQLDRQKRERERDLERRERERIEKLDRMVEDVQDVARALTRAMLLVEGYHTHKGTWRKQRDLVGADRQVGADPEG